MKNPKKLLIILVVILVVAATTLARQPAALPFAPSAALAQGKACPDIVKAALTVTDKQCARAGRNKACYGNNTASVEPQTGITTLKFAKPGDIADVKSIRVLRLGDMDTITNTWGIALMRLQADLPDTTPQDNVTLLLFGAVEMTDAAQEATIERPTQIAEFLTAQPTPTPGAPTFTPSPTPKQPYVYKPLQAFYFKSGTSNLACTQVPPDGILIQSPQGKQKVELSIDGAQIQLGSTVFLQAQASGEMTVNTLEGSATVTAFGQSKTAGRGQRIRVPLDANLKASGPPILDAFYDNAVVQALPVSSLPQVVPIPVAPPPGTAITTWHFVQDNSQQLSETAGCQRLESQGLLAPYSSITHPNDKYNISVAIAPDGGTMWLGFDNGVDVLTKTSTGAYSGPGLAATTHFTLNFTSSTHAEGQREGQETWHGGPQAGQPIPGCLGTNAFTIDRIDTLTPTATP